MDAIKAKALELAVSDGGHDARAVDRAEAYERFLRGEGGERAADTAGSGEAAAQHWSDCAVNNAPYLEPGPCDCGGLDASAVSTDGQAALPARQQRLRAARDLLIDDACFPARELVLGDYLVAGMPEWMARAAVAAQTEDLSSQRYINKAERIKEWGSFAQKFLRLSDEIRAPDPLKRPR